MARTVIPTQAATADGITLAYAPANASGGSSFDRFAKLFVNNGSGSPITLTFTTPATVGGLAIADKTATVAAGVVKTFDLSDDVYSQPGGKAWVDYSATTSVTVAVLAR